MLYFSSALVATIKHGILSSVPALTFLTEEVDLGHEILCGYNSIEKGEKKDHPTCTINQ